MGSVRTNSLMVLMRGGGDLATGIAYRLSRSGFPIIVLELPRPLVVRRRVALATAVLDGEVQIEGLIGRRVKSFKEAIKEASKGIIPVLVSPGLPSFRSGPMGAGLRGDAGSMDRSAGPASSEGSSANVTRAGSISILIDARMAKRNIDTRIDQAALVIGLGPGFTAGFDCHAVIETKRGHHLGRVFWSGPAAANTGTPGSIAGKGADRVLRAPVDGIAGWGVEISQIVEIGQILGEVSRQPILAPFDGVVRGLIAPGTPVKAGLKIGDVDARGDVQACFTISDKALAIGGGVLEAILTWMNNEQARTG